MQCSSLVDLDPKIQISSGKIQVPLVLEWADSKALISMEKEYLINKTKKILNGIIIKQLQLDP